MERDSSNELMAARQRHKYKHPRRLAVHRVASSAHPIIKWLFAEIHRQQCEMKELSKRSGVGINTMKMWKHTSVPTLDSLEAVCNVLGFEVTVKKRNDE